MRSSLFLTELQSRKNMHLRSQSAKPINPTEHWEKIVNKVLTALYPNDHQNTWKLWMGTGINFYYGLIQMRDHIRKLRIRIPDTFCMTYGTYILYNDEEGYLNVVSASLRDFYDRLYYKYHPTEAEVQKTPICVFRSKDEDDDESITSVVWTWKELEENSVHGGLDGHNLKVLQEFVPQKNKISSYRVILNEIQGKVSFGILRNLMIHSDNPHSKILSYKPNSFEYFIINEHGVNSFLSILKTLKAFLNRVLSYIIQYMVADFIKGEDGQIYMISLRFLQLDKNSYNKGVNSREGSFFKPDTTIKIDNILPSKCRLCMSQFSKSELTNRVPLKMLLQIKLRLMKRGYKMFSHLQHIPYQSHNHGVYICNLCFLFITQEQNLTFAEKKFAYMSHIPYQLMPEEIIDCLGNSIALVRPPLLQDKLLQWRILFHANYLRDIDSNSLRANTVYTVKFKTFYNTDNEFNFNQDVTYHMRKSRTGQYSCSPSPAIFGNPSKEPLNFNSATMVTDMRINKIRVNYIFTVNKELKAFCDKLKVTFSIWKDTEFVAQGSCFPLIGFDLYSEKSNTQIHSLAVYMFTNKMKTLRLELNVGLCCDNEVDTTTFNLYKLNDLSVYYPDNYFYSSHPFPSDWMKIFTTEYLDLDDEMGVNSKYKMHLTKREYDPHCINEETNQYSREARDFMNTTYARVQRFFKTRHNSLRIDKSQDQFEHLLHKSRFRSTSNEDKPQLNPNQTTIRIQGTEEVKPIIMPIKINSKKHLRPSSAKPLNIHKIFPASTRSSMKQHKQSFTSHIIADTKQRHNIVTIYDEEHEKKEELNSTLSSKSKSKIDLSAELQNKEFQEKHKKLMKSNSHLLRKVESVCGLKPIKHYLI